ncbi:MAG: Maf family protein [Candidatus Firestonebacteria bacterium]
MNIILASKSPRREELLKSLGLKIKIVPANIKEDLGKYFSKEKLKKVALDKINKVAKKFKKGIVIGADTIVVVKNKVYGKPDNIKDARRMLKSLSGKTQYVWTAVAIKDIERNKVLVKTAKSSIKMKKLDKDEINYLANKNLDKAGSYGLQEDDKFLKVLSGSYTNIVGFPMELVQEMLRLFNVKIFNLTK